MDLVFTSIPKKAVFIPLNWFFPQLFDSETRYAKNQNIYEQANTFYIHYLISEHLGTEHKYTILLHLQLLIPSSFNGKTVNNLVITELHIKKRYSILQYFSIG